MLLNYLNSQSDLKIIKVLILTENSEICFQDILNLTGVGTRSAQITIKKFINLNILATKVYKNRIIYRIKSNEEILLLKKYFLNEEKIFIKNRSKTYIKKSKKIIPRLQDLYDFGQNIKKIKQA